MFLKITTPSDEAATAVVETAILCGTEPTDIKQHRIRESETPVFSVYIKGTNQKLDECRKLIVKQSYYVSGLFTFRAALAMTTLATEEEE